MTISQIIIGLPQSICCLTRCALLLLICSDSTCQISYGFRNCKSLAPAVNTDDIKVTQIGVRSSKKPILKVKIQWKVPKAGEF